MAWTARGPALGSKVLIDNVLHTIDFLKLLEGGGCQKSETCKLPGKLKLSLGFH